MNEMHTTDIHIGQMIEQVLDERGMTKAEFGRRINTSRQNINSLLRKRTVDVMYLFQISKVLEYDFFAAYSKVLPRNNASPRMTVPLEKVAPYLRLKPEEVAREMMKLQEWQFNFFSKFTDDLDMIRRLTLTL